MSQWNDLSRDRLIKEYRKHPCLWSNKDEDIKNAEKRKESLALITAELNKYEQQKSFTQEEVRTQFKNLRDMYRRKRKKLQLQLETNVAVDEPGWVYFQRLKFLDDSIDFSLPSDSTHLPPPKKKGKTGTNRSTDDASLPTPLEENSNGSTAGGVFSPPPNAQQTKAEQHNQQAMDELVKQEMGEEEDELLMDEQEEKREQKMEDTKEDRRSINREGTELTALAEHGQTNESQQDSAGGLGMAAELRTDTERSGRENVTISVNNNDSGTTNVSSSASISSSLHQKGFVVISESCSQMPSLHSSALFPTISNPTSSSNSTNPTAAFVQQQQQQQRRTELDEEDAEEFTCFGRFVAMTLRKITARSPIDALEARKEISDVLYLYQKQSLSK